MYRLFFIVIVTLSSNRLKADDTRSGIQKMYYYKKFDQVITESFYRDTGYKRATFVNDSVIVIDHSISSVYLVKYFHERKLIYADRDTINLNQRQPELIEQLNRLINVERPDITIDSVKKMWESLTVLKEEDSNYYKSLLTDCLLYYQLRKAFKTDTVKKSIPELVSGCINALGPFTYVPNLCTKWPLYSAFEGDKIILKDLKEWHGVDISKIFDLNEQYSFWHNMTSDSLKKIQYQLSNLADKYPHLYKRHRYLFEIPLSINMPLVLKDEKLDSFELSSRMEGKYTIMYFWGTWCAPCINIAKEVLPVIREKISGADSLQLFTIASESNSRIEKWLEDINKNKSALNNLVALSEMENGWSGTATPRPLQLLEIFMIPNFFVIGPDKEIILRNDINGKETMKIIDSLLLSNSSPD